MLRCPACGDSLGVGESGSSLVCDGGHRFDVARQGYVNLLGGPQPANADTGEMVAARERVLGSGLFDPVSDAVAAAVVEAIGRGAAQDAAGLRGTLPRPLIVDAGAGTGHHLARAVEVVAESVGIAADVSVAAARRAARAHGRVASVVADTWRSLPVVDGAADALLCLFAPRNAAEFARVLAPGGTLVVVTPTPRHLAGLRASYELLEVDPEKDERLLRSLGVAGSGASGGSGRPDGGSGGPRESAVFDLVDRVEVTAQQSLDAGAVADVIAMGPNAFHGRARESGFVRADADVEISVNVWRFQKVGWRGAQELDQGRVVVQFPWEVRVPDQSLGGGW